MLLVDKKQNICPNIVKKAGNWYFVPISIVGSKELQQVISKVLERSAKAGDGLFSNVTDISKEDEALDALLGVEVYNCKHSFTKWLDELMKYNVAGKKGAFLDGDLTRFLFQCIRKCANIISDNTDKPNKVKNDLNDVITKFDALPIWGLFFQILILQGLCTMLERIDINEGQSGFDEAQSLYNWLAEALICKVVQFANGFYGDDDLIRLQPFGDYLCTTVVGEAVQQWVKGEYYKELQEIAPQRQEIAPQRQEKQQAGNCEAEQAEPQQKPKNRQKGRKAKLFADYLLGDEKQRNKTLEVLHVLLQGKRGKDVVLRLIAAVEAGKIIRPAYNSVVNEFGGIGSKQNYYAFFSTYAFTDDEKKGAKTELEDQLQR